MEEQITKIGATHTRSLGYIFYGLCKNMNAFSTLEIGIARGYISAWLSRAMSENKGQHYAIEIDQNKVSSAYERIHKLGYGKNLCIYNADSMMFRWIGVALDFVFLDSEHTYDQIYGEYKRYISAWLNKGGYVAIHDYNSYSGVKKACDEIFVPDRWDKILLRDRYVTEKGCGTLLCQRK